MYSVVCVYVYNKRILASRNLLGRLVEEDNIVLTFLKIGIGHGGTSNRESDLLDREGSSNTRDRSVHVYINMI